MHRENEKYHTNEDFSLTLTHSALKARMLINLNKFIRRNMEKKEKVCLTFHTYKLYVLHNKTAKDWDSKLLIYVSFTRFL